MGQKTPLAGGTQPLQDTEEDNHLAFPGHSRRPRLSRDSWRSSPSTIFAPGPQPGPVPAGVTKSKVVLSGCRILLVNALASIRKVGRRMLHNKGAIVTVCTNGSEALEAVAASIEQNEHFHCILLDSLMADLHGIDTLTELKKFVIVFILWLCCRDAIIWFGSPRWDAHHIQHLYVCMCICMSDRMYGDKTPAVIGLTSDEEPGPTVAWLEHGAQAVVPKPFTPGGLLQAVYHVVLNAGFLPPQQATATTTTTTPTSSTIPSTSTANSSDVTPSTATSTATSTAGNSPSNNADTKTTSAGTISNSPSPAPHRTARMSMGFGLF